MRKWILNLATCCFAFFVCFGIIPSAGAEELRIFVGAGLRQPVDQLVQEFQEQTGHSVFADYGGSGQLLTKIEAASKGDLFIPGSLFYIEKLEKAGRIQSSHSVVYHTPVIGVNARQAQRVTVFEDLAKPGIRLAMGDPKAMAFGRTALSILEKSGMREAILKNVTVYGATVNQLALYVSQGVVDAAIIGRSDAFQNREKIAIVPIPEAWFQSEIIAVAILKSATNPDLARMLSDYLSSAHAVEVFQQHGFLPLER
ncbi:MAG: molybdate ABC transporter substrate-binding protein [Desulfobacterales bacterium]|nr:molybdate ABC transporter substrate-binding protein [Desulfobacterales bacterium]MDD3951765.1 molybdate ABC transporter substrate-binding protein [Desulfobacterales bacterium]